MKFSLKTLAAAVALAVSAGAAHADITNGAGIGNGELLFNIWDDNGSYTRGLGSQINTFQTTLAAAGDINSFWTADATLTSFLGGTTGGTRSGSLKWNVVAPDQIGQARLLSTYTLPEASPTSKNENIFLGAGNTTKFINIINPLMAGANLSGDSLAVDKNSPAYAGKLGIGALFATNFGTAINFNNTGSTANNTFASGLGFMRMDAAANNSVLSVYNEYYDPSNNLVASITNPVGGNAVRVFFDSSNTLHIQAVPEPESYAMLLAGLGMLGFMARRRLNNRV